MSRDKVIYLTRHCQAEHNVASDWYIPDAPLTKLGREQAKALHASTKDNIQKEFDVIISSPLRCANCCVVAHRLTLFHRRTLQTTVDGYPDAIARLGGKGKIVLLPSAQECNDCEWQVVGAPVYC